MNEHSLNVGVTVDIREFKNGLDMMNSTLKNAGSVLGGTFGEIGREGKFAFNSIQQAANAYYKDAQKIAVIQGVNSDAFKEAASKYIAAAQGLQQFNAEMGRIDAAITGGQAALQNTNKSFNLLGYSVAQMTREMPAFAHSAQVGFLALSNNIPIFADAIIRLKGANAELKESGQVVPSVAASVVKALFSWQTALSIGVTVLTIYGSKIIDFISNLGSASVEITAIQKRIDSMTISVINQAKAWQLWNENYGLTLQGKDRELFDAKEKREKRFQELAKLSMDIQAEEARTGRQNLIARNELYFALLENARTYNAEVERINQTESKKQITPKIPKGEVDILAFSNMQAALDSFKKLYLALDKLKLKYQEFTGFSNEIIGLFDFEPAVKKVEEVTIDIGNILSNAFSSFAVIIGNALADGASVADAAMSGILSAVGGVMVEFGQLAIATGLAAAGISAALKSLNPVLAISAGIALVALGSYVSRKSANIARSATSGGGAASGSAGGGFYNPIYDTMSTVVLLDGRVRGSDIVISARNQNKKNGRVK